MGIEYVLDIRHPHGSEDRWCPRIRCDGCRQLIGEGSGNVFWPWVDEEEGKLGVAPAFFHKRCPDGAHREPSPHALWTELDIWLTQIAHNAGVDLRQAAKHAREWAELGL